MKNRVPVTLPLIITLLCLPQLSETIYTPSLPDIASSLHTTAGWVEMTLGIYFLGFAAGVFLWGCLCDRLGRRMSMLGGLVIYVAACFGCLASTSIEALLFWRVVQGFGASVGSVVTQTILRDCFSGAQRNQLFSIAAGALSVAPGLGPIIGGVLAGYYGWEMNFVFLAGVGTLLFAWSALRLSETRDSNHTPVTMPVVGSIGKRVCTDRKVWVHVWLISACNGIEFGYFGEAPFIFHHLFGYSPEQYGLFGLAIMAVFVAAAFSSHRLNRIVSAERIIRFGCIIASIGAICTAGHAWLWTQGVFATAAVTTAGFLACYGLVFLGIGLVIPNSLSIALSHYREVVGTAGAWFGLLYYIGISALMGCVSWIHNGTIYPLSLFFLVLSFSMYAVWQLGNREERALDIQGASLKAES